VALYLSDNEAECTEMAQVYGALAYVGGACVVVSGKEVKIEDLQHSVMEGFEITNFNFHCSGVKPAVQTQEQLPGPSETTTKATFV
jgi:hypothetical protein